MKTGRVTLLTFCFCCCIFVSYLVHNVSSHKAVQSKLLENTECEPRWMWLVSSCTEYSTYRVHYSHTRLADYIEPKTKSETKVRIQQSPSTKSEQRQPATRWTSPFGDKDDGTPSPIGVAEKVSLTYCLILAKVGKRIRCPKGRTIKCC